MTVSRNPFTIRRSESIDGNAAFVNLFEPGVLEILDPDRWHENVHLIRSARGGGKTSLLRLFTPSVLNHVERRSREEPLKDLLRTLRALGAIDDNGVRLLGVMLMCGRNYTILQDLDLDEGRKRRLFFGLLNSRIVLATVRAALELAEISFPEDASHLTVTQFEESHLFHGLSFPCSGKDIVQWASDVEGSICNALDSFGPMQNGKLLGHDDLISLHLIRPDRLQIDGRQIAARTLLMMDDIHKLTEDQRSHLIQTVIEYRSPIGVWIAERFEALAPNEMLASGSAEGRDHQKPIAIESYWRKKYQQFEKYAMRIADRRVQSVPDTGVSDFRPCLASSLGGPAWDATLEKIVQTVSGRLGVLRQSSVKYSEWYDNVASRGGSWWEQAVNWRAIEILIAREDNRRQKSLFDDPLPVGDLNTALDASVRDAAELFLAREFGLPYYYGPERIARLASLNIQQFLGIATPLFEDVRSAVLLGQETEIPPDRQHRLMKEAAKAMWEEIPRTVKHGREVRNLIDGIGKYAHDYTYRPTAPNDPGVAGSGIRMSERSRLLGESQPPPDASQLRLRDALASAMSHNLLVPDLDYKCKNEFWMVLNLNRLLCVHYDLPLGYGLYKERPVKELVSWLDRPFESKPRELLP